VTVCIPRLRVEEGSIYEKPLVVARRGDAENAPENTLPAFESAISRGADAVELDVHLSLDGELVVHHFYNLGTTDNGQGLVCEHTLAALKALDSGGRYDDRFAGESKPTLRQVLDLCQGKIRLEIDMKDSGARFAQKVVAEVETIDWDHLLALAVVHLNLALITADFVDRLHERGFMVHGSNLDSVEQIERGLDLGIDSFSTGHLGMALRVHDRFVGCRST
jgi:glycerophosphoryl diester phosphodiesterase